MFIYQIHQKRIKIQVTGVREVISKTYIQLVLGCVSIKSVLFYDYVEKR